MKYIYQYRLVFDKNGQKKFEIYHGYSNLSTVLKNNNALSPSSCIETLVKQRKAEGYNLVTYTKELRPTLPRYYFIDGEGADIDSTLEFDNIGYLLYDILLDIPEVYQGHSNFDDWFNTLNATWQEISVGLLNHEAWCNDIAKYVQIECK